MPPQRRPRPRRSRDVTLNPVVGPDSPSTPAQNSLDFALNVLPLADVAEEAKTEPSTPISHTRAYRRRALWRERNALFVQAVLQYDREENDLQPWYW